MEDLPTTYQAWRRTTGQPPLSLTLTTEQMPESLEPNEVLVKIYAVSLNFRDAGMLHGRYPRPIKAGGIPTSDCSALVMAVGSSVDSFNPGDAVTVSADINYLTKDEKGEKIALGGNADGVLREYAVFNADHVLKAPARLTWEEVSTLPCATLTSWSALHMPQTADKGNVAYLQGTGGVSMGALLICLKAGIHPIITSSSDAKLEGIKKLAESGKISTINYKTQDIEEEIMRLTEGKGVDIVVNTIGSGSLEQDVRLLRRNGKISLVGFLGNPPDSLDAKIVLDLISACGSIHGIYIGSCEAFEEMNEFMDAKELDLDPLIDRKFAFSEAQEAFDYMYAGKHVGKVIISLQ